MLKKNIVGKVGLDFEQTQHLIIKCKNRNGPKGMKQWPINVYISPMMTLIITSSVDQNQRLKRFNTQLNKPTNHNSVKVLKVVT